MLRFGSGFLFFCVFFVGLIGVASERAKIPVRVYSISSGWNAEVSTVKNNVPLRDFLQNDLLPKNCSFFLDRRLDPEQLVSAVFDEKPFLMEFDRFTRENQLDYFILDNIVYVGPVGSSGKLRVLLELNRSELSKMSSSLVAQLLKVKPLKAKFATSPSDILDDLAQKSEFQWQELNRFPFDLWNELDLSPLPVIDQISLLLAGFDCRLAVGDSPTELQFVRCRPSDTVERTFGREEYEKIRSVFSNKETGSGIASFANCRIEKIDSSSGSVRISGPFSELSQFETHLIRLRMEGQLSLVSNSAETTKTDNVTYSGTKKRKSDSNSGTRILSGELRNVRLTDLFAYLQKNFQVEFQLDDALSSQGVTLDSRISCRFNKSNVQQTAKIIATTLKVKFKRINDTIIFY